MSSQREPNVKPEPLASGVDKSAKTNNGYAIMMLPTLENITNKLSTDSRFKSPYRGFVRLSQRELGVGLLVTVLCGLLFASLPEQFLHSLCTLLKIVSRILLPGLTVASVFYWSSVTVQKYFDSHTSLLVIPVFFVTDICTQLVIYFTGSNSIMAYLTLLSLLTFSCVMLLPGFRNEGTYVFTLFLLLSNVFDRMVAGQAQTLLRYFTINLSACVGELLTRVTHLPVQTKPAEIEAKVSLAAKSAVKVRRSSSASSTNSNRRRTSLPALGFQTKSTIDPTTLGEAHGMLSDLLADSNLPANVASTLKIISNMIAQPTFNSFARPVNPMSPLVENRFIPDETVSTKISEQPDMMDDVQIHSRSRPHHLTSTSRRMSNLWTTTTSATGMPTVERDSGISLPNNIACNNVPGSPRSGSPTTFLNSKLGRVKSLPHNTPHLQDSIKSHLTEARSSSPSPRRISSDSGAFTAISQEKPTLEETCKTCGCSERHEKDTPEKTEENCQEITIPAMSFYGRPKPTVEEVLKKAKDIHNSEELEKLYDKIDNWNFPIFDVWSHGNVLRGFFCISLIGLSNSFSVDQFFYMPVRCWDPR